MVNMFRFELRRLLRKPSFYVCLGLSAFYIIFILFSGSAVYTPYLFTDAEYAATRFSEQFSPEVFSLSGESRMLLPIFLAVFTGIYVSEDKVQGTIKNIYARGYSRTVVFFARYLTSTITAVIFFLVDFLTAFCGSTVVCATSKLNIEILHVNGFFLLALGQFVSLLAINTFYFMLSESVNHTGSAMSLNLFVPALVRGLLSVVLGIIFLFSSSYHQYEIYSRIVNYWIWDIVYMGFVPEMEATNYMGYLIMSLIYILVFGTLSWLIINKKQVKG